MEEKLTKLEIGPLKSRIIDLETHSDTMTHENSTPKNKIQSMKRQLKILEKNLQSLTETNLERWSDNGYFTSRKILKQLSNNKHNNPLYETIRHNYHQPAKSTKS